MNLALQKRHEQLERWRQHEASVELLQQQQLEQQENTTSNIPSKTKQINFSIQPAFRRGLRGNTDKNSNQQQTDNQLIIGSRRRATLTTNTNTNLNTNEISKKKSGKSSKADLRVNFSYPTLFLTACANGDLNECERLLNDSLINIDVTTSEGLTGLHQAAICGNAQMVEFLINRGANINCSDNEGWTPLHAASSLGLETIVKMLLDFGADATIVNCENLLAYDLARDESVRLLIAENLKGIDIDFLHNQEERLIELDIERWIQTGHYEERSHPLTNATVLHVIAAKGYVNLMKRILETPKLKKQINLEAKDYEGFTPLLAGSFWSQTEIVELLIEHGANIFAQANNGYKISSFHLQNYQQGKLNQEQNKLESRLSSRSPVDKLRDSSDKNSGSSLDTSGTGLSYNDNSSLSATSIISGSAPKYLRHQGANLMKTQSLDSGQQPLDTSNLLTGTMSVDRLLLRLEAMTERELRKSYKDLVMENEKLRRYLKSLDDNEKQKQQDWIRKERQLERKISELEEENKQLEQWRIESQRLKDENSSLIRVLSKISKKHD